MDKLDGDKLDGDKLDASALQAMEERVAHLQRSVDDLSDVVARQDAELRRLSRHVGLLLERDADREAADGSIALSDQKPPHW